MKTTTTLCLAVSLALASAGTAQADWGRPGHYRDYDRAERHHGHGGANWIAPAALLAITGLAIGAAYSQRAPASVYAAPVYAPPPQPVQAQPESGAWYYCNSSGQYYPYTNYCPEGWQAVMPPRQ